ncbi:MAG: prepilin-type N-terminal cleavage/methylation domain-containing protein [Gammaproteobacteria bacterium]
MAALSYSLKAKRGFTLIEVLVVLVIVNLISLLLIQGFSFLLDLRLRVTKHQVLTHETALQENWFRSANNAIVPNWPGKTAVFAGTKESIKALTLQPLLNVTDIPAPIEWTLTQDRNTDKTSLFYREGINDPIRIAAWSGAEGKFTFFDQAGKEYEQWPPSLKETPQLPAAIHLQLPASLSKSGWHISLCCRLNPRIDLETPWYYE